VGWKVTLRFTGQGASVESSCGWRLSIEILADEPLDKANGLGFHVPPGQTEPGCVGRTGPGGTISIQAERRKMSVVVVEHNLTPRELEVAKLIARGFTYIEIGVELHIAASTVNVHARSIREKLGVRNSVELVNNLHNRGLL
jgi:DNA-binding CsgD family transcriptional regulator